LTSFDTRTAFDACGDDGTPIMSAATLTASRRRWSDHHSVAAAFKRADYDEEAPFRNALWCSAKRRKASCH
jgi:hypothetical protein